MAIDRQGTGLAVVRVLVGVFFLFEGLNKWRWLFNASILAGQLSGWQAASPAGALNVRYLSGIALPGVWLFARLVPAGEIACGLALIFGVWTTLAALVAFLMALNFQFASGALVKYSFLTSGYGLPVLGSTLGLAIGGVRLPWSIRG
ncbi:MAG TPA: DoxX family protein [Vicinamibacterales bacterium]|jgi:uncharacterized membrane protein YphA (DoxX/SURF4 family)|nr:DoxX family protein [Vicinamibacterales bacterium]